MEILLILVIVALLWIGIKLSTIIKLQSEIIHNTKTSFLSINDVLDEVKSGNEKRDAQLRDMSNSIEYISNNISDMK